MPRSPCSELSKVITELALNIGERPDVHNLDHVVEKLREHIPEITREVLVSSINEATSGYVAAKTELQKKLDALKREARDDKTLTKAVADLQSHLAAKTVPKVEAAKSRPDSTAIAKLKAERERLSELVALNDPAKREAVRKEIATLDAAAKAGTFVPREKRTEKPIPADLAALRAERERLRRTVDALDPAKRTTVQRKIDELSKAIAEGRYIAPEAKTSNVPADVAALRERRDALQAQMRMNDPAKRTVLRKQIAELDAALTAKKFPASQAAKAKPVPVDIAALRSKRDAIRAKLAAFDPARVKEWQAKIDRIESHIQSGTLPNSAPPGALEANPEVAALKSKQSALLAALKKSDPALRKRFEAQIANLTDRLDNGVFTLPPAKAESPYSKDIARLEFERDALRTRVRRQIDAIKPKTIWGHVSEPLNAARAIMTSFDLSGVLRQGGFITLAHPVRTAKAFPEMLKAFGSDRGAYEANREIKARENAPLYAKSGLFLSEVGGLGKQEESFVSRMAGKIPLVHASERAYTTILNRVRADSFDAMVSSLGRDGAVTKPESDAIANFINVATGRGKLSGSWETAANALNTVFFAPRLALSRFQLIAGQPFYQGTGRTRRAIAGEYGRYLAGIGVVYALGKLAGGTLEDDPRSADFGKLKFGDTRLDPLSGLAQASTLIGRLALGGTKNAKGEIEPLRGPEARQDSSSVIGRFFRSKLSPIVGAGVDVATGKNVVGEAVTPAEVAGRLVAPLAIGDVYQTMKAQDVPKGVALSLLTLLGMGVNTYTQKRGGKFAPVANAIDADDTKAASDSLYEFLSEAKPEKRAGVIQGIRESISASSPLGGMTQIEARKHLATLAPDEAAKAVAKNREWKAKYTEALRRAAERFRDTLQPVPASR